MGFSLPKFCRVVKILEEKKTMLTFVEKQWENLEHKFLQNLQNLAPFFPQLNTFHQIQITQLWGWYLLPIGTIPRPQQTPLEGQ